MNVPARISIVTLGVADLERSARFYEALGWVRAAASNDEIVWFATSDSVLGLHPRTLLAEDANLDPSHPPGFGGITIAINLESESSVDEAMETALAAGATSLRAPERTDWGGYRGYFADPDGHPWEIAYNPFIPIDETGSLDMG